MPSPGCDSRIPVNQSHFDTIRALMQLVAEAGGGEVEVTDGPLRIRVAMPRGETSRPAPEPSPPAPRRHPAPPPTEAPATSGREILAAMHGVFHRAPAPGAAPFVTPGAKVQAGQQICILEAMKVFTALRADADGIIGEIHADDGQDVAAGQRLFTLLPEGLEA